MLPGPRLNRVSRDALEREGMGAYNTDGSVPWRNRELMATEGRILLPKTCRSGENHGTQAEERVIDEMRLREMPPYLQDMLVWLYDTGGEAEEP